MSDWETPKATTALVNELRGLYFEIVSKGLPSTLNELQSSQEADRIAEIGRELLSVYGVYIAAEIGGLMYPQDDELAFTANLILSLVWGFQYDVNSGYWSHPPVGERLENSRKNSL